MSDLTSPTSHISSLSTSFTSSTSLRSTGLPALDRDLAEVMEYFDCELESSPDESYVVIVKLPFYGPSNWVREFCYLRVCVRMITEKYDCEYELAKVLQADGV
jgi:hypothetical protein